jgi:hypothetical protein
MREFLTLIAYLFHPIYIPFAGTVTYFLITPKYTPLEVQGGNILPVFILTVIIPIISYLILRNLGLVHSVFLQRRSERIYPLLINLVLLFMVLLKVIPNSFTPELYYFFVGLIVANGACLLALLFKVKCSLHMAGMGSLLMFLIALSIHFETNVTLAISIITLAAGLTATSRLYLKAQGRPQLLIGFFIGFLTQLFTLRFWL